MEGLSKAKVISLEVTVYSVPAVILFCAKHNGQLIGDTPTTISRAFRKAERFGMGLAFEGMGAYDIFTMTHAANWFASEAVSDMQMMSVGMAGLSGRCDLSTEIVLLALFGLNVPEEVAKTILEGRFEDLGPNIAKVLKDKGVDWEEKWLRFATVPTPEPTTK